VFGGPPVPHDKKRASTVPGRLPGARRPEDPTETDSWGLNLGQERMGQSTRNVAGRYSGRRSGVALWSKGIRMSQGSAAASDMGRPYRSSIR
jgi:hypothetical protein